LLNWAKLKATVDGLDAYSETPKMAETEAGL